MVDQGYLLLATQRLILLHYIENVFCFVDLKGRNHLLSAEGQLLRLVIFTPGLSDAVNIIGVVVCATLDDTLQS